MQTTSTEALKSYVFNEPIVVDAARMPALGPASMFMVIMNHHFFVFINGLSVPFGSF